MKDEANIVKQYADSDVGERINILIKHYPNFIRLVEGYEQSLGFIIKQEKECRRRSSLGELGVRVQSSKKSDPTAREAIDNIMIMQAIQSGELSAIISDLDDDVISLYESEIRTIRNMKEDYSIFQSTFFYLEPEAAETLKKYLSCGRRTEQLAYDLDIKPEALKMQMYRSKKVVVDQTANILVRKYRFEGGKV